nr:histidinol-phosphatase HisJ family protein [Sporomusa acidovorans]OZC22136.1 histidinol-phosphatase [Sporomusa acidovorans DSM 3132]
MILLADSHVHTKFSADAIDDMLDMCKTAIDKGLSYICFTEHVDNNPFDDSYRYFDYDKYSDAIERTREKYGDKILVLSGIEFGEPHIYRKEFENIITKKFDVVMAGIHYIGKDRVGVHWVDGTYKFDKSLFNNYTKERIFHEYYEELLQVAQLGSFDVLAHFDNPKRYLKETGLEKELISEIIYELVNKGVAIEINTSPLRKGYHECSPDSDIFKKYLQAGGTRVTIGSDAHCCREIAMNLDYAVKLVTNHKATLGIFKERCFIPI